MLMEWLKPASVVDVGCGRGEWLAVFLEHGLDDVLGIDGDYVDRSTLSIPPDKFCSRNLTESVPIDRRFDLAICLEVGEHLPATASGPLVDSLTRMAPIVCFSAAIPGQGGTSHVNEQWPAYWAKLFSERGYRAYDILRSRVWCDPEVAWFYAQNMVLYAAGQIVDSIPELRGHEPTTSPLPLVHPGCFELYCHRGDGRLRTLVKALPGAVGATLRNRWSRWMGRRCSAQS